MKKVLLFFFLFLVSTALFAQDDYEGRLSFFFSVPRTKAHSACNFFSRDIEAIYAVVHNKGGCEKFVALLANSLRENKYQVAKVELWKLALRLGCITLEDFDAFKVAFYKKMDDLKRSLHISHKNGNNMLKEALVRKNQRSSVELTLGSYLKGEEQAQTFFTAEQVDRYYCEFRCEGEHPLIEDLRGFVDKEAFDDSQYAHRLINNFDDQLLRCATTSDVQNFAPCFFTHFDGLRFCLQEAADEKIKR